jgi:biopolymer transport protein ExbB
MSQILDFFQQGGIFMVPIALCLLFSIIFSIERGFKIFFVYNVDSKSFVAKIQNLIINKKVDQAITLCNGSKDALLPTVIKSALTEANQPIENVANNVERSTLEVLPLLERRSTFLPMLGNSATLLGLLGTIVGLIEAFAAVAHAEPSQKAELLTQSISIAMNTTAFGLIVAIPTLIVATLIQEKVSRIIADIDQYSVRMVHLLGVQSKSKAK